VRAQTLAGLVGGFNFNQKGGENMRKKKIIRSVRYKNAKLARYERAWLVWVSLICLWESLVCIATLGFCVTDYDKAHAVFENKITRWLENKFDPED
jgi:hypothetical protein